MHIHTHTPAGDSLLVEGGTLAAAAVGHIFVYIYVHIFWYMYIYIYTYIHVYIYKYLHQHTPSHTHLLGIARLLRGIPWLWLRLGIHRLLLWLLGIASLLRHLLTKKDRGGSKYQECATIWCVCSVWHGEFVVFHNSRPRKSKHTLEYVASFLFQRYLFLQDAFAKETKAFCKRALTNKETES